MMNVQGRKKTYDVRSDHYFRFYGSDLYGSTAPYASHINQRTRGSALFRRAVYLYICRMCYRADRT